MEAPVLPPGWSEHKAPSGHTYYHNKALNKSTYTRPEPLPTAAPAPALAPAEHIPSWSSGEFALGYQAAQFQAPVSKSNGRVRDDRFQNHRNRKLDGDKPKHRYDIKYAPWILVKTKYGRRFVHNTETNESFWKFPQDVMKAVVEYDKREREKKERRERGEPSEDEAEEMKVVPVQQNEEEAEESEYEEVTDSEGEDDAAKRQRTDEPAAEGPRDLTEEDMLWQLQEMQQDGEDYPEEEYYDEEPMLSDEDARQLFRDLLDDSKISPFTPWNRMIEEGRLVDDERYVALPNMKARKECFDEWSRERIQAIKEQREKQAKQDPRVPYFALLDEHASTKLYWPEFKRKFRKEAAMKDMKVSEKDKEKYYREHIKRLAMHKDDLKKDLSKLLKTLLPLSALNRDTSLEALPSQLLTDLRFISLPAKTRNPMLEAYISTLAAAPANGLNDSDAALEAEKKRDRERREKALREREERVQEAKLKGQRDLKYGRQRLQEREAELQRAMRVGKEGLKGHLADVVQDNGTKDEEMKDAP